MEKTSLDTFNKESGNTPQNPEDIKLSLGTKQLTEENAITESAPLVKKEVQLIETKGKAVTLTFRNLTYSVPVKNPNKTSSNDKKCKLI